MKAIKRTLLLSAWIVLSLLIGVIGGCDTPRDSQSQRQEISRLEHYLWQRYGIVVTGKDDYNNGVVQAFALERRSLFRTLTALRNMRNELSVLPPEMLQRYVQRISLVSEIQASSMRGENVEGYTSPDGRILLSVGSDGSIGSSPDLFFGSSRIAFFHEFTHRVTSNIPEYEWRGTHPGVRYGRSGLFSIWAASGFAREYGQANYKEDMGTCGELLRLGYSPFGYNDPRQDGILRNKIEFLRSEYKSASGDRMNAQYWRDLYAGKVNESYWNTAPLSQNSPESRGW